MGREVKRVALDFEWPRNMIWKGFLNPYRSQPCKACDSSGLNPATKEIADGWYGRDNPRWTWVSDARRYNDNAWQYHLMPDEIAALVKAGRLKDLTHTWSRETGWVERPGAAMPTAEEVREWAVSTMGHDAINRHICVKTRAKRLGVYGHCPVCNGDGEIWHSPEVKKLSDDWEGYEPPAGDGFQMWEATSEGSPISPVFDSAEKLAHWLADTNASAFGRDGASYEQWLRVCNGGYAPSAVADGNGLRSGVAL